MYAVKEQLSRTPYDFPLIKFKNSYSNLEDYKCEALKISFIN
jgi:hypothetical protein